MATFRNEKMFTEQNPHKKPFQQPGHQTDPRQGGTHSGQQGGHKQQQPGKQPQKPEKGHW